jgi:hypothetical protein
LKSSEVSAFGNGRPGDCHETILVAFLGVFVYETTRVDAGHLGVVKSSNFFEFAGVGVATILRKAETNQFMEED